MKNYFLSLHIVGAERDRRCKFCERDRKRVVILDRLVFWGDRKYPPICSECLMRITEFCFHDAGKSFLQFVIDEVAADATDTERDRVLKEQAEEALARLTKQQLLKRFVELQPSKIESARLLSRLTGLGPLQSYELLRATLAEAKETASAPDPAPAAAVVVPPPPVSPPPCGREGRTATVVGSSSMRRYTT